MLNLQFKRVASPNIDATLTSKSLEITIQT